MNINPSTSTTDLVEGINWVLSFTDTLSIVTIALGVLAGIIVLRYVLSILAKH